jgi:hypothetical protein
MGRLIDDEAIFKAIESHSYLVAQRNNSVECGMTLNGIKQVIDELPTAFDVDKLISYLEAHRDAWNDGHFYDKRIAEEKVKTYNFVIRSLREVEFK